MGYFKKKGQSFALLVAQRTSVSLDDFLAGKDSVSLLSYDGI